MPGAADTRNVELVPGVDVTRLPLSPTEGFVLSRIQGRTRVAEVLALCGLPAEQLEQILRALVRNGAVRLLDASGAPLSVSAGASSTQQGASSLEGGRPASPAPRQPARNSSARRYRAVVGGTGLRRGKPMLSESPISGAPPPRSTAPPQRPSSRGVPAASSRPAPEGLEGTPTSELQSASASELPYDPAELQEGIDFPIERQKQLLTLHARLDDDCDHYEALGVSRTASRKEIRSAYFALSKAFHPDTMFRRELGRFKPKMELVFHRITQAYDILSRKGLRAEYDAYLAATRATRKTEEVLERAVEVEVAVGDAVARGTLQSDTPTGQGEASGAVPVASTSTERGREVTRKAVGRRLEHATRRDPAPVSGRPGRPAREMDARRDALRGLASSLRQASEAIGDDDRVALQLAAAKRAEQEGDLEKAHEHLRKAVLVAPERGDLKREHARLSTLLASQLANDYEAQAELEERQGKWASAALSWSKVYAGRDEDPRAACRVAAALLRAGTDIRQAYEYAQKAVLKVPDSPLYRVTLAKVMLQIGLPKGAKRELEAARKLDPKSEIVKNLLAELKG